jgi:Ca-activated chloride channel family protein
MHIQTDRALVPAHVPSVRYLHVAISAPPAPASATDAAPRTPAAAALVLDRSGSMAGTKIAMARTAVQQAIRLLKPSDELAVVCYDDKVDTVLARASASDEAKALALRRLAEIDARGSTDLCGGWLRGAGELQEAAAGVRRVLLLTDGLANHGETDPQALVAQAADLRAQGITTSTFGVGADFDEELLGRIATHGGGHFYFIEQPRQIPDFLASELGDTLEVTAREAVFEVVCPPGVHAGLVNDLPVQESGGLLRVSLGDLVAGQELTLVVAVSISQMPAAGQQVAVTCRVADRDTALFPNPMTVQFEAVDVDRDAAQPVNLDVLVAVAEQLAARARAAALRLNREGRFDDAQRVLRDAVRTVLALSPGHPSIVRIAEGLRQETPELAMQLDALSLKRRHYAAYEVAMSRVEGKARRRVPAS